MQLPIPIPVDWKSRFNHAAHFLRKENIQNWKYDEDEEGLDDIEEDDIEEDDIEEDDIEEDAIEEDEEVRRFFQKEFWRVQQEQLENNRQAVKATKFLETYPLEVLRATLEAMSNKVTDTTTLLLESLVEGDGILENKEGIWGFEDTSNLEYLMKKHGYENVMRRISYLVIEGKTQEGQERRERRRERREREEGAKLLLEDSDEVGVPLVELGDKESMSESNVDQHSRPIKRPCVDPVGALSKDQLWECVQIEMSELTDDEVQQLYEKWGCQAKGRELREFILEGAQARISGLTGDQLAQLER